MQEGKQLSPIHKMDCAAAKQLPINSVRPLVDRPIFIVGPHRSGTTLIYSTLARHPDMAYFTEADRRLPRWPTTAHLLVKAGIKTRPHEAQKLWDLEWNKDDDRMDAEDARPDVIAWYTARVRRTVDLRGRTRFLAKYPRHSLRLEWLDTVFPGCLFLHVTRDWRAVVHSTAKWRIKREAARSAWFGVRIPGWRERDSSPPALVAGRIFRYVTQHLEQEATRWGSRFVRIAYEDFCARPLKEIGRITEWAGLSWSPQFEKSVERDLQARNDSWREGLSPEVVEQIRAEAPEFFARHER